MRKILKMLITFMMVGIIGLSTFASTVSMAAEASIDLPLLESENHPNASEDIETRMERHQRLLSEGYILENIQISNAARTLYITGSDGKLYETRISTTTYTQPPKTTITYGEDYLNIITNSTLSNIIQTAVGFINYVGWIPTALGINTNSIADFLSRGRVTHTCNSTLFYYDIEVKLAGTNKYYFVASSQKYEIAITATSSGFTQLGSPVQKTVSGFASSKSPNYDNERTLSEIAVEYFVTGGPDYTYSYFEHYDPIDYVELK